MSFWLFNVLEILERNNLLELLFPMVLNKKFYLKNCVQSGQKISIIRLFMHTLYNSGTDQL